MSADVMNSVRVTASKVTLINRDDIIMFVLMLGIDLGASNLVLNWNRLNRNETRVNSNWLAHV